MKTQSENPAAATDRISGIDRIEDVPPPLLTKVAIIGAGATGVELSAELRNTAHVLNAYGLHQLDPRRDVRIHIVEAGPRILPALSERVSAETTKLLRKLDVDVFTSERVTEVTQDAVLTASGKRVDADLTVWAAGITAPGVLRTLGLPVSKMGQIVVGPTLQTETDPDIFAFGDCAAAPWPEKQTTVPPRAQAAHQQATFLYDAMRARLADILGLDAGRVAIKATTSEKMGFTGRGEGLTASATATIRLPWATQ